MTITELRVPKQPMESTIVKATPEIAPDDALVNNAYSTLQGIFTTHYVNALLEAGRYIIDNFYDGKIELARQRKPQKAISLTQLINMLKGTDSNSPSRSWIFNAVSLVIDEYDYSKSVHTYGQLPTSHRVILLAVKDQEQKTLLIKDVVANNLTVIQLKGKISDLKQANKTQITLMRAMANPNILFGEKCHTMLTQESLSQLTQVEADPIRKRAQAQVNALKVEMEKKGEYIKKYEELIAALGQDISADKTELTPPQYEGSVDEGDLQYVGISIGTSI